MDGFFNGVVLENGEIVCFSCQDEKELTSLLNLKNNSLTLKTYCFQYNLLLRFFGDIEMGNFTTEKLKGYLIEAVTFKAV